MCKMNVFMKKLKEGTNFTEANHQLLLQNFDKKAKTWYVIDGHTYGERYLATQYQWLTEKQIFERYGKLTHLTDLPHATN